jgi:xanthine/uracil permease
MTTSGSSTVHPVDQRIPMPRLAALGFQHVLVTTCSCILLTSVVAVALNLFFNGGGKSSVAEAIAAAKAAEGGH